MLESGEFRLFVFILHLFVIFKTRFSNKKVQNMKKIKEIIHVPNKYTKFTKN